MGGESLYVSMGSNDQYHKKYTWSIQNSFFLGSEKIYSTKFVAGGCNWCFLVFPKGNKGTNCLSLYLHAVDSESMPSGWRRYVKFRLTIVNQFQKTYSLQREMQGWFGENTKNLGFDSFLPINELLRDGFFVNRELMVVAEINVLEVIGKLDVREETSPVIESMDVNGFHVLTSQVESVKYLFNEHPNIAANFGPENQFLKTAYMSLLLGVTKILSQSTLEISKKDLDDACAAVVSLKTVGFKLDWLEKRLEEVRKMKDIVVTNESRNVQKHQESTEPAQTGGSNLIETYDVEETMKNLRKELKETMDNYTAACIQSKQIKLEEVKKMEEKEKAAANESRNVRKHQQRTDQDQTGRSYLFVNHAKLDEIEETVTNLNETTKNLRNELKETMENYAASCIQIKASPTQISNWRSNLRFLKP